MDDIKQDKAMVKKAVRMHDKQLHGGKRTDLKTLNKGGVTVRGKGAAVRGIKARGPMA